MFVILYDCGTNHFSGVIQVPQEKWTDGSEDEDTNDQDPPAKSRCTAPTTAGMKFARKWCKDELPSSTRDRLEASSQVSHPIEEDFTAIFSCHSVCLITWQHSVLELPALCDQIVLTTVHWYHQTSWRRRIVVTLTTAMTRLERSSSSVGMTIALSL